jgi:hypothetical protein
LRSVIGWIIFDHYPTRHHHGRNYRRRSEQKVDDPAVPVTPEEQVESTHEAFEAGASLVHIHVRNPDQSAEVGGGGTRADGHRHPGDAHLRRGAVVEVHALDVQRMSRPRARGK